MTDARMPTFDLIVPGFTHEFSGDRRLVAHGQICRGSLAIEGCSRRIELFSGVNSFGVQVVDIPDDALIDHVWDLMRSEVARYWTAPRIPVAHYVDADRERADLGVAPR
jgi:hypothetical protein